MVEKTIGNTGTVPKEVSADAGCHPTQAVEGLSALGVDPFIAPDKTRHGQAIPPAPRGRIPRRMSARDRMRRKLWTKRGGGATGFARKRWSRSSVRSSRAEASGSSSCGAWSMSTGSGC